MKKVFYVVLAQLCILAAWQVLAHSGAAGLTVPAPATVAYGSTCNQGLPRCFIAPRSRP